MIRECIFLIARAILVQGAPKRMERLEQLEPFERLERLEQLIQVMLSTTLPKWLRPSR